MRIAMLSQWYDPERGAAMTPGAIARSLRSLGDTVDVVTGFPNYPEGEIYPGYRMRPYQREVMEDVTVHRVPLYMSHDANARRRALNYLSYAVSASVFATLKLRRVDAALVHSSPATAAIPAMVRRLVRRTPYVVHIQDLWPDTVTASGFLGAQRSSRVERILHRFCDRVYRHASAIAVTSPGMADRIAARGVPRTKIAFAPNWADERYFHPVADREVKAHLLGEHRPFVAMYAGAMGDVQALETVIEAAHLLRGRTDIDFVLVGGGVAESALRERAESLALDNVRFVPRQPAESMSMVLAAGDVQIISLRDLPLFRSTLPSKLQATLAAGRPIICAVGGDAARVVEDAQAGIAVNPEDPQQLADAVASVADMRAEDREAMGARGRRYYESHLSEERGAATLHDLLEQAMRRRRRT